MSFTKVNKVFEAVSLLSESFLFSGFQLIDNSFHLSVLNCFLFCSSESNFRWVSFLPLVRVANE